jgi:hypothetical protein
MNLSLRHFAESTRPGIRADPNIGPPGYEGGINSAILRYVGAPVAEPTSTEPADQVTDLVETDLHVSDRAFLCQELLIDSPSRHSPQTDRVP